LENLKNHKLNLERRHAMKKATLFLSILLVSLFVCTSAFARVDKPITVQASVLGATSFNVQIFKSVTDTTYNWTTDYINAMNFGTLANAVPADLTSALGASSHFLALVSVNNNTNTSYHVQFTGAPLRHTDGSTLLSNDAWTVLGGFHLNTDGSTATVYTSGVNTTKRSAGLTTSYDVYTSNTAGLSDIFRVYFAITGDPTKAVNADGAGAIALIPPTQKSGSYSGSVTLTLLP
jgi:hypothetical protein